MSKLIECQQTLCEYGSQECEYGSQDGVIIPNGIEKNNENKQESCVNSEISTYGIPYKTGAEFAPDITEKRFTLLDNINVNGGTKGKKVSILDIVRTCTQVKGKTKETAPALVNPAYESDVRISAEYPPKGAAPYFCIDIDLHGVTESQKSKMIDSLIESPCVIFAAKTFNKGVWALVRGDNHEASHKAICALALAEIDERRIVNDSEKETSSPIDLSFATKPAQVRAIPYDAAPKWGRGAYVGYQSINMPTKEECEAAFKNSKFAHIALRFMQQARYTADELSRSLGAACAITLITLSKPARYGFGTTKDTCTVHGNTHCVALADTRMGKTTAVKTIEEVLKLLKRPVEKKGPKTGEQLEKFAHQKNTRKKDDGTFEIKEDRKPLFFPMDEAGGSRNSGNKAQLTEKRDTVFRLFMDGRILSEDSAGNTDERADFAVPVEGAILEGSTLEKYAAAVQKEDRHSGVSARRYEFLYNLPKEIADKIAHGGRKGFLPKDIDAIYNLLCANEDTWKSATPAKPRKLFMTDGAYLLASMGASFKYCDDSDYPDMIARISGVIAQAGETAGEDLRIKKADVLAALWVIRGIAESRKTLRNEYVFEAKTEQTQFTQDLLRAIDEAGGQLSGQTIYMRLKRSGLNLTLIDLVERQIIEPVVEAGKKDGKPSKRMNYKVWESYHMTQPPQAHHTPTTGATTGALSIEERIDRYFDTIDIPTEYRNNKCMSVRGSLIKNELWNEYARNKLFELARTSGLPEKEARTVSRAEY